MHKQLNMSVEILRGWISGKENFTGAKGTQFFHLKKEKLFNAFIIMFLLDNIATELLSISTGKIQFSVDIYVLVSLLEHKRLRLPMVRCTTNKAFISREFPNSARIWVEETKDGGRFQFSKWLITVHLFLSQRKTVYTIQLLLNGACYESRLW